MVGVSTGNLIPLREHNSYYFWPTGILTPPLPPHPPGTADTRLADIWLLSDEEASALWDAIRLGFLVHPCPSFGLLRTYLRICALVSSAAVVLRPRRCGSWAVVAAVPRAAWLPALTQNLARSGAWIDQVFPEEGVVCASVTKSQAVGVARDVILGDSLRAAHSGVTFYAN